MDRPDKLVLTVMLRDGFGRVHAAFAEEVPQEIGYRGDRVADDFRFSAEIGMTSMNEAAQVLQVNELRRKLFVGMMPRMAAKLADFLYDREGWSDPSRQESTECAVKNFE